MLLLCRFTSRSAITKVHHEGDSGREAGGQIQIKWILLGTSPHQKSNTADDSDYWESGNDNILTWHC